MHNPILLLLLLPPLAQLCTLCHFRVPPRPRPLDQYKLPSMAGLQLDRMPEFCNVSKSLPVAESCRAQFEKIFCSIDLLVDSFSGCKSAGGLATSSPEACSQCAHQKHDNLWTVKWLDSFGKPAAGISDGNYYWLGDYEMCTEMRHLGSFEGQYCRVELEVPDALVEEGCAQTDPLSIVIGACFPAACSAEQLTGIATLFSAYNLKVECESDSSWSSFTYILLSILTVWMGIQVYASTQDSQSDGILSCFSIAENAKRASSTRRESGELHVVHGLEFLVFFFLIAGNVYNYMLPYIENVGFAFDGVDSRYMHIVNNFSYQVDGLLALSAFFTTFLLFNEVETLKDCLFYITQRFMRFWPAYFFCIIFMYMVFPGLTSGPMWIHTDTVDRCETSWWKNVLFINNFFPVTDTCLDYGYIISLEAQLFVILVFCVFLAKKFPTHAKIGGFVVLVISIIYSFVLAFIYELPPAPMLTVEPVSISKMSQLFTHLLQSPASRISTYAVGFIFGLGCATPNPQLRSRGFSYKPHILLGLLCVSCIFYTSLSAFAYASRAVHSPIFDAIYAAIHRPAWAFALLSFVYLCYHSAFAWLNAILGWRVFAPLSKLSWIALLVSEPVILYFFSSPNKPTYATHWSTMYTVVSAAFMSYLFAFLLDVFVTRPVRYLVFRDQKQRYEAAHTAAH